MINLATLCLPAMLSAGAELGYVDFDALVMPAVAAPQGGPHVGGPLYGNGIGNGPNGSGNPRGPSGGTPEPTMLLLFAGGALAYGGLRWRKSRVTATESC